MASDADFELAKIRFRKLYGKAKELDVHKELTKLEFVQQYKEKKLNIIVLVLKWIFFISIFLVVCALGLYGAVKTDIIAGKTVAEFSTLFTGVNLRKDGCIYPFTEIVLDLFRPPVNCSFCHNIRGFDRVQNLSPEGFAEKYAYTGRPLIITDVMQNWTAGKTFSFDYLKSVYEKGSPALGGTESDCQFFPYQTEFGTLGEVFKMSEKRKQMKGKPWYIGWSNCDPKAANALRQHYDRPYFLSPEMESSRTDWIFMGTPGYGAHIHIDAVQQSSWQAQIQGKKTWIIEPPPECYYECVGFKDTVQTGETIVIDTNRWFHGTNVEGDELSITIGSEYD